MDSMGALQLGMETSQGGPWERVESQSFGQMSMDLERNPVRNQGACLAPRKVLPKILSFLLVEEEIDVGGESAREG